MYKLFMRMKAKLTPERNGEFELLKEYMCGIIFERLHEIEELTIVSPKYALDFKASPEYAKIDQIVQQYLSKYKKDLPSFAEPTYPIATLKEQLTKNILTLFQAVEVEAEDLEEWKEEVIVLDYLITLRQLIAIIQGNDLEGFHLKSKI
jgi:hypothetical protein